MMFQGVLVKKHEECRIRVEGCDWVSVVSVEDEIYDKLEEGDEIALELSATFGVITSNLVGYKLNGLEGWVMLK